MAFLRTYLFPASPSPSEEPASGGFSGIRKALTQTASAVAGVASRVRQSVLPTKAEKKKGGNRAKVVKQIKKAQLERAKSAPKAKKGEKAAPLPEKEQKPSSLQTAAKVAAVVTGVVVAAGVAAAVAPTLLASSAASTAVATGGSSALVVASGAASTVAATSALVVASGAASTVAATSASVVASGLVAFTVNFDKLKEIAEGIGANPRQLFELAARYMGVTPHPDLVAEAARIAPKGLPGKMGSELIPAGAGIVPSEAISPVGIAEFWENVAPQIITLDPPADRLDIVPRETKPQVMLLEAPPTPHPIPKEDVCGISALDASHNTTVHVSTPDLRPVEQPLCPLEQPSAESPQNTTVQLPKDPPPEPPKAPQESSTVGLGIASGVAVGVAAAGVGGAYLTIGSKTKTPESHQIDVDGVDGWKYQITIQIPPDQKGKYSQDALKVIAESIAKGVLPRVATDNPGLIRVGKAIEIDFPSEGGFAVRRQDQPTLAYTYKPNRAPQGAEKEYNERLTTLRNIVVYPDRAKAKEISLLKTWSSPTPPSPRAIVAPPPISVSQPPRSAAAALPQPSGARAASRPPLSAAPKPLLPRPVETAQIIQGELKLDWDVALTPIRDEPTQIIWSGNSCFCSSPLWSFFTNEPAAYTEIPHAIKRRLTQLRSQGNIPTEIYSILSKDNISLYDFEQLELTLQRLEQTHELSPVCKELLSLLELHHLIRDYQNGMSISGKRVNSMRQIAHRVNPKFRDTGRVTGDAHELFQIIGSLLFEGSRYNQNLTITRTGDELRLTPDVRPNWGELLLPMPEVNDGVYLRHVLDEYLTPLQTETVAYRKKGETVSKDYEVKTRSRFDHAPPFLSLTLNRARVDGGMDMRPLGVDEEITVQGVTYELVGVSRHKGSFAHYDAAVKKGDSWYLCDDNRAGARVVPLEAGKVSEYAKTGYMFFYRRVTG